MLTKLLLNKWTWIIIAVIAASIYVYGVVQENRELRAENEKRQQNEAAVQDSLFKMKDSVQTLAVKVGNLQSEVGELNGDYVAVNTKYQIALDTIKELRKRGTSKVIGDSIGIVEFHGTKGIATYDVRTEINVKSNENNYSIEIAFADIETQSTLYYDDADKLWKIRTLSLSPGVKLRALSIIDDETYRKIQGLTPIQIKTPSTFGLGGLIAYDRVYGGIVISPSQWMFTVHYKLYDKYLENERWSDKIMIGVHYYIW